MNDPVAFLIDLLNQRGSGAYLGEAVTQREHALQSAHLAEQAGAVPPLIVAALLHDIGHLLGPGDDGLPPNDDQHEVAAARWLAQWFPPEVTEPIRLHVADARVPIIPLRSARIPGQGRRRGGGRATSRPSGP